MEINKEKLDILMIKCSEPFVPNKYEIESNDEIGAYDIIILVNQLHHAEPLELLQKYNGTHDRNYGVQW